MENNMTFMELGLSENNLNAINKKGFEEPTSIQIMTIPAMLKNNTNIIAQAHTGTGKTAAFGLPLIDMIDQSSHTIQALVLTPTRELAIQVAEEINSLKGNKNLIIVPIYGGQSIDQQLRRLKKGIHIVVGTPGRIIDHLNRGTLNIREIEHLIFDEADEMLNMGFIDDMEEIMKHTNPRKRMLMFSATIPQRIKDLAHKYMGDYEFLSGKKEQRANTLTEQIYFEVKASDKFEALCRIIDIEDGFYGLIFCRTKNDVNALSSHLTDRGYDAECIHGDITQAQREKTLGKFKNKKTNILVATDVAARGIDVNNLSHVINYSLPEDPDSYVHRIGRTGRAGNEGTAITFITPREYKRMMFIQRAAKADIKKSKLPVVKDIIAAKKKKIDDDLKKILEKKVKQNFYEWAKELLATYNHTEILASLLHYSFEEELNPDVYSEIEEVSAERRQLDGQGKARLFVALGKKDKLSAKKLVNLVTVKASVKGKDIRDVQILDNFSFITVPFDKAEKIIMSFKDKHKKPLITHAKSNEKSKKKKKKRR